MLSALANLGVPEEIAADFPPLPGDVSALLIYGSRARGDAVTDSDLDVLALVQHSFPSTYSGVVNVSFYTRDQLKTGIGTLFGAHLQRDAKVFWDPEGDLTEILNSLGNVDTERLFNRVKAMSPVFGSPESDLPKYLAGLLREARYLLRSSLYAQAIAVDEPCFSVRELAIRHSDPALVDLLASRHSGSPLREDYDECLKRLESILGRLPENPHGSLEALIVNEWENRGDLLSIAFMALGIVGSGGDYAELEKILL
ncbi:hypothetical protein LAUMK13_04598 [Mycobacterium innocens]|uniref:Polymerase nucleotidyl transferase domain-containing protein n=1 Tax=Mycobacterium innocens TaxID=2341083 RepID=A0A498QFJ9_9MYCO|nr:nucleotidyltransferase domain-containing protein [Mycobacterium kansasii]VBA43603.1 hypothetical protein LAUMK13_04598 [Mycobacterium innocens]